MGSGTMWVVWVAAALAVLSAGAAAWAQKKTDEQWKAEWYATLSPEQLKWEKTLEANLGDFYWPRYLAAKRQGRTTAWDYVQDDPALPRVLLIGDSISRGYTVPVRKALEGKANVHRAPANCGPTRKGLADLDVWLGDGKWDLIHFNFGIHDRNTPPVDYEHNLEEIVKRLQATGAKLVWASSTPIPADAEKYEHGSSARSNAIAEKVMQRHGIPVTDLYGYILPDLAKYQNPKDCHFKGEGYERLGARVADGIMKTLGESGK